MMHILYALLFLTALTLNPLTNAHLTHDNEHRDLPHIYYGPDSTNINFLPVPPSSTGLPVSPQIGYYLEHLGNGTYFITDGSYQTIFLVSTHGVIVVDCPPTLGYKLKTAIHSVTHQPITHFVYSHAHADHVGGAYIFNETVTEYIAHYETRQFLERLPTPDPLRPLPNVIFHKDKTLRVGNQTLELSYKGLNHLEGNIFIHAPAASTLMLVDVVFPGWAPFSELAVSTNIPGWLHAHDQILEYDFDTYIGGHVGRYGTREDVVTQKQYVNDLLTNCAAAINGGFNVSEAISPTVAANPVNPWALFKAYLRGATDMCAETTNRKWTGKLAGLDVFGWENAYRVVESSRLDFDVLGINGVQPLVQ